ncbi:MAG: archaellin/type IV pilin N-terminal domain-containing protein [Candidatus Aenigmatarchaeota archaeon]
MKGVSEVVAMVMMLVITLALAGTAYVFISRTFTVQTQGIQLDEASCFDGSVTLIYRNIGDQTLTVNVFKGNTPIDTRLVFPGRTNITTDSCGTGNICRYRIVPSVGKTVTTTVQCI